MESFVEGTIVEWSSVGSPPPEPGPSSVAACAQLVGPPPAEAYPIELPDPVGVPVDEALLILDTLGMVVEVTGGASEDLIVVAHVPPVGARVELGSAVAIEVDGP